MCYNFSNKKVNLQKALRDLEAESTGAEFTLGGDISAFVKQPIPVIVNFNGVMMINAFWGTQENSPLPTKGKNLKSENTHTYYNKIEQNRCLVPISSYYEYKTVSKLGRKTPIKMKHEIFWKDEQQFYIAAFYNIYENGNLGFGLITTIPNPVQAEIHDRMIITLDAQMGKKFLERSPIEEFQYPQFSPKLEYINLDAYKLPPSLFD